MNKQPTESELRIIRQQGTSVKDAAGLYGVSQVTISRWYRKFNISRANFKYKTAPPLNDFQMSVILGGLLGDAWINNCKYNCCFSKEQKLVSKEYVLWQFEVLKPYSNRVYEKMTQNIRLVNGKLEKTGEKDYCVSVFNTSSAPIFTKLRHEWYCDKTKIVPDSLRLNPTILAVWFCDDGVNYPKDRHAIICTDGFSSSDCEKLTTRLKIDLDIESHLIWHGKHNRIYVGAKHYKRFIETISPHIIPCCMKYKVDLTEYTEPKLGWQHPSAKTTPEKLQTIFNLKENGMMQKDIAKTLNLSDSSISEILQGKRWGNCLIEQGKN